jgi:outer membrane protein assembly factor BamB
MNSPIGLFRTALILAVLPLTACNSAAIPAAETSADWPQFRGPSGMGTSGETGLPVTWSKSENIVWQTDLPGAGTSSPIIVGERIFVTCYSGYNMPGRGGGSQEHLKREVVCLNRADGKIRWAKEVETKLPEQDRIRDDHGYASSTPAADGERVYVFFGKSGVAALSHEGKQLWQADVGDKIHGWGSAASPVLYENLVIVNASVESDSLFAFDKASGREAWRARGIRESWNTPLLVKTDAGKTELIVAIMGKVLGFDPLSGDQLWSCNTDIAWYMVPSLVAHDGIVYCIGGRTGGALAVRAGGQGDVTRTHRLWTGKKGSNVTSPIYHDGHLYWMHENLGIAYCAEAKTGKMVYEERVPRASQIYASPLLADGRLYYLSRQGRAYVVAAKPEYEQLAVNELGERGIFDAGPVAAAGRLYLRTNQRLYCIGKQ